MNLNLNLDIEEEAEADFDFELDSLLLYSGDDFIIINFWYTRHRGAQNVSTAEIGAARRTSANHAKCEPSKGILQG